MSFPEPLLDTRTVGRWRVHAIQAGGQQLDGGAMFGVVPKPLWERKIAADEKNRIPMGMRCLLVEHDDGLVLIDTGVGNKETTKFHDIYGIENQADVARAPGRTALEAGIARAGFAPADITLVINTHLHFDHAGGNTYRNEAGEVLAAFPNARYVVQRGEYEYARRANERTSASYFPHNWDVLFAADRFDLGVDHLQNHGKVLRCALTDVRGLPAPFGLLGDGHNAADANRSRADGAHGRPNRRLPAGSEQ